MKYGEHEFSVVLLFAQGLDGVMRVSLKAGGPESLAPAVFRWEFKRGHLGHDQLEDIAAAVQHLTYTEVLTRYGLQGSLPI
jgi:hypothetical protein